MTSSEQLRTRAAKYTELAKMTASPDDIRQLKELERSCLVLADNEEWLERNFEELGHTSAK